ncbi:MAG: cytochrome c peroxidase [Sulfuricella sp.]
MNTGLLDFFGIGATAIVLAVTTLILMVKHELGPFARLSGGGKLLLASALGMGILAFTFKMTAIATIAFLPQKVIAPMIARQMHADPARTEALHDVAIIRSGIVQGGSYSATHVGYIWQALPERAPAPADNPTTPEKVALGKRLFFDPALSRDGKLSCASCHDMQRGAGNDGRRTAQGVDGQIGGRNVPTIWNAAFQAALFWDGRAASLEEQASGPMLNPIEMGMPSAQAVEQRVRQDASYSEDFARVFGPGEPITMKRIVSAIAAYERTLITPDTPYDRFVRGDRHALSPAQQRGMALFQSTGCINCHYGPNFSAASLFDQQSPQSTLRSFPNFDTPYRQRYQLTRDIGAAALGSEIGAWRVPSLRNVALTAPYFHNGSVDQLEEAVRIMASSQLRATLSNEPRPARAIVWQDEGKSLSVIDRPTLSDRDVTDIVAFLNALSSDELVSRTRKNRT